MRPRQMQHRQTQHRQMQHRQMQNRQTQQRPLASLLAAFALLALASGCPKGDSKPTKAAVPAALQAAPPRAAANEGDTTEQRPAREAVVDTGDLDAIRARGFLRVLVFPSGEAFLPRQGTPTVYDRELAQGFARELGVDVEIIPVARFGDLIPMLNEGKGDLIAARMTVTEARAKEVAFTRPTQVVSEVVVGKKGAQGLPSKPEALAGREVHVRPGSSYAETLRALAEETAPGLEVIAADPTLDDEQIVHRVGAGELPLTVVDSDVLEAITAYDDGVTGLFPVREGRQIAWAVRRGNPELRQKADAFLIEHALTQHTREVFTGDLDGIQKRGVLRVLTRNNPVTYFLYRGQQHGFDYELAARIAKDLGVRLEMVVPPSRDELVTWLHEGRGDMIAAAFTVTEARKAHVAFSEPYLWVDEVVVQKKGAPPLESKEALAGKELHVRASSSYAETVRALAKTVPVKLIPADETSETEELIARVAAGEIPYTVADTHLLDVELTWRDDVEAALRLTEAPEDAKDAIGKPREGAKGIAFAVRKESPALKAYLDGWVKRNYRGVTYNILKKRYFENAKRIRQAKEERFHKSGRLSPYDALIQRHAREHQLDWRLMAAQAYQESRFDPNAKSWVGALGLFQVMPATGKELGFTNLKDPEEGTQAGIRYMARLVEQFEPELDFRQRLRFALASYNAGRGHVLDARRLAKQLGLDPNRWFGNVEKAMLLLADPKYHRAARHGYVRGEEPVRYVSEIQSRYDAYVKIVPE